MLYQKHDLRDELLNWTSAKLKKFSLQKKKNTIKWKKTSYREKILATRISNKGVLSTIPKNNYNNSINNN